MTHPPKRRPETSCTCAQRTPPALRGVPDLQRVVLQPPGVYFLCEGDEVVYVGQSVSPAARVTEHYADKSFGCAYVIPVPIAELSAVEGAFLRALTPHYNRIGVADPATPADSRVLAQYAPLLAVAQAEEPPPPEPAQTPTPTLAPVRENSRRKDHVDTNEAAEYLGLKRQTLEAWRVRGGGPVFCKVGRLIRYRRTDLDAYLDSKRVTSTSEYDRKRRSG